MAAILNISLLPVAAAEVLVLVPVAVPEDIEPELFLCHLELQLLK
jgi:hypothetical protein